MNRMGSRTGEPGATDGQPLTGFDVLRDELTATTKRAVVRRLRAGQGPDRIRAEVPLAAARAALDRFPNAPGFEESVMAFTAGVVERELSGSMEPGRGDDGRSD